MIDGWSLLCAVGHPEPWNDLPLLARMVDRLRDGYSAMEAARLALQDVSDVRPFRI